MGDRVLETMQAVLPLSTLVLKTSIASRWARTNHKEAQCLRPRRATLGRISRVLRPCLVRQVIRVKVATVHLPERVTSHTATHDPQSCHESQLHRSPTQGRKS